MVPARDPRGAGRPGAALKGPGPALKSGFGRLATIAEAKAVFAAHPPSFSTEWVPLRAAAGRTLAGAAVGAIDVPHFDRASMDGYALAASDTSGASASRPVRLRLAGLVPTGAEPQVSATPGSCLEIGTGAPMPAGADAVVMVEHTSYDAATGEVLCAHEAAPGENVIAAGSDVEAGTEVLPAYTVLQPRHVGVLAAIGLGEVEVIRRPRVAVFSTGPELVHPGDPLGPGRVYDINTFTLEAACAADGAEVIRMGIVPDDPASLDAALALAAGTADLALGSGGSSMGGGDLVVEAFGRAGTLLLHGVAVKPGKPMAVALAGSCLLVGLPGYPVSALSDYQMFVRPWLLAAQHRTERPERVEARLAERIQRIPGRHEFLLVRLEGERAFPLTRGSAAISGMSGADGYIEVDAGVEALDAGTEVKVTLL